MVFVERPISGPIEKSSEFGHVCHKIWLLDEIKNRSDYFVSIESDTIPLAFQGAYPCQYECTYLDYLVFGIELFLYKQISPESMISPTLNVCYGSFRFGTWWSKFYSNLVDVLI